MVRVSLLEDLLIQVYEYDTCQFIRRLLRYIQTSTIKILHVNLDIYKQILSMLRGNFRMHVSTFVNDYACNRTNTLNLALKF